MRKLDNNSKCHFAATSNKMPSYRRETALQDAL